MSKPINWQDIENAIRPMVTRGPKPTTIAECDEDMEDYGYAISSAYKLLGLLLEKRCVVQGRYKMAVAMRNQARNGDS